MGEGVHPDHAPESTFHQLELLTHQRLPTAYVFALHLKLFGKCNFQDVRL